MKTLDHADPYVRLWTARLLCDRSQVSSAVAAALAGRAAIEPDVEVRSQLACSARRLPARDALPIVRALLARSEDAGDIHVPLLLWWAIEAKVATDPEAVLALFRDRAIWDLPIVRTTDRGTADAAVRRGGNPAGPDRLRPAAGDGAGPGPHQAADGGVRGGLRRPGADRATARAGRGPGEVQRAVGHVGPASGQARGPRREALRLLADERADTRELEDILITAYPTSTELMELADRAGINKTLINWGASSSVIGHSILTVASQHARLDELIIAMWIDPSAPYAGTRLRALLGEGWGESHGLREPSDVAVADPLETVWLPNGAPLVNRMQLRKGVRELLRPGGVRILVVNGPPGSGKSYSAAFIRGIGQATGEFKVAQVQHGPGSEPYYGPAELGRDLGSQLGIEQRPRSSGTSDWAYYRTLVAELVGAAIDSREPWWWILDGFSSRGRQDIMEFILLLAERVTANSDVRLVLLGYDQSLPEQVEGLAYREEISPISESDIREFLTALSRTARRAADEGSIEQSIRTIFTDLPMDEQRNVALGVRVLKAAGQFAR